jgi:hypothetical protein
MKSREEGADDTEESDHDEVDEDEEDGYFDRDISEKLRIERLSAQGNLYR